MSTIHLGYDLKSGASVAVPLAHTAVTGMTQTSGKTTTLEALIHRSGRRAIAFLTKRGEGTFQTMRVVPPYFAEATDWRLVRELLEATMRQKLRYETSWIIRVSKNTKTLAEVHENVREAMGKAKGMNLGVYECLNAYLEILMPQIKRLEYSRTLDLKPGLNVMDLTAYSVEMQGMVVRSVLEWVYERERKVIVVIPEAWELIPQDRGSPVRLAAETYIRKGGVLENFLFLDSQDLRGVHKNILGQVRVWILGVQRESNEVVRTLRQFISEPARPKPDELMTLAKGQFFVGFDSVQAKIYVQPHWMTGEHARAIALGEETIESAAAVHRDYLKQFEKGQSYERRETVTHAVEDGEVRRSVESFPARRGGTESHGDSGSREAGPAGTPPIPETAADTGNGQADQVRREGRGEGQGEGDPLRDGWANGQTKAEPAPPAVDMEPRMRFSIAPDKFGSVERREGAAAIPSAVVPEKPAAAPIPSEHEDLYRAFRARLLADPAVLAVLREGKELAVITTPAVLEADENTPIGAVGLLIDEGFFADPKNGNAICKEIIDRRRRPFSRSTIYEATDKVAQIGFLVRNTRKEYHSVPGLKVTRKVRA